MLYKNSSNEAYVTKGKLRSLRGFVHGDYSHTLTFVQCHEQILYFVAANEISNGFQRCEQLLYKRRCLVNSQQSKASIFEK